LIGDVRAVRLARTMARTELTRLRWEGDIEDAARLVAVLVERAVLFDVVPGAGETITLRLEVLDNQLRIEVGDPKPTFARFGVLRDVLCGNAELEWFLRHDLPGKVVRAAVPRAALRPAALH
jgi:hypothetical protein